MKEKILAAIKAKFPAINLSKKRLEAIAAIIEKKVIDDETKIDAALATYDEYNPIAEIAKQDDAMRTLEAHKKANPGKKEDPIKPADPVVPVLDDTTPEWVKLLVEQNKKLAESVTAILGKEAQTSMRTKAIEKLKDVPASYWGKRPLPEKDEDLDAFVTDVQTDYTAFTKEMTDNGFKMVPRPASGTPPAGGGGGDDKTVSPEIKAFAEKQAALAAKTVVQPK